MPEIQDISTDELQSNPEWGFSFSFNPESSDNLHLFCGPHKIEGAACPNCSKPLLRLVSLTATDLRLNVDPSKINAVHLLYCWTCSIPNGVFSYRLRPNGSVDLLNSPAPWDGAIDPRGPFDRYIGGPGGPYDGYNGRFPPRTIGLVPLSDLEQRNQKGGTFRQHAVP